MLVYIFILIAIICSGLTAAKKNEFFKDYCSPKNTATINGIFSVLIFLSHSVQYVKLDGVLDAPYFDLRSFLGQLVVVTYLFYSGYGIMESARKKGTAYIKAMPKNRLFKLWYHFAIVVILYIITAFITGRKLDLLKTVFAFTGATSVGNSNWYMFVTFAMYIIIIVAFLIFKKSNRLALIGVFVLTGVFAYAEYKLGLASRFYNTIFCFPAGMLFSELKPYIDKALMKNDIAWYTGFTLIGGLFVFFSHNRADSVIHHSVFAILGALLVTVAFMKINVSSSILDWFGEHIFSFFILQRIPMALLKFAGVNKIPVAFIILSFFSTVLLAMLFDTAMDKLDGRIFGRSKR